MNIKVADIVFLVADSRSLIPEDKYKDFFSTDKHEITIRVYNGTKPEFPLHNKNRVFDSELIWSLYQDNEYNIFVLKMPD